MLGDHVRCAQHVIIEEQEDDIAGFGGGAIARRRGTAVGLLDDGESEGQLQRRQGVSGAVGRPIDHDHRFDFAAIVGPCERLDGRADDIAPLIGRDQDRKGRERRSVAAQRCSPAMPRK
jgi:hypothetical protein